MGISSNNYSLDAITRTPKRMNIINIMKNIILVMLILGMSLLYNCETIALGEEIQPSAQQLPPPMPPDPDPDPQHGDCPDNTNPACPEWIPPIIF